jgi:hypothetical protein
VAHVCGGHARFGLFSLGVCRCWVVLTCVTYMGGLVTGRFDDLDGSLSHIGFDD